MAELVGTFALVFCGTGAIVINQVSNGAITHVGIAATFGLVVMGLIYSLGDISGAHLNPAVTLALSVAGRFPWRGVLPYLTAQILGALLASAVLKGLFPGSVLLGATMPSGSEAQSFVLEVILTFLLMLVILNSTSGPKDTGVMAGVAIGAVVGLEAMFAGPICGASMNPARSIGPAVVSQHLEHLWIYLAAPVLGAALAVPVTFLMRPATRETAR